MSDTFKAFGDAARLYATNYDIVRQIERMFDDDMAAFADAIQSRVQANAGADKLEIHIRKQHRTMWLESADLPDPDRRGPFVWFHHKAVQIVQPGILDVVFTAAEKDATPRAAYTAVQGIVPQWPHCTLYTKGSQGGLFDVRIDLGGTDPVGAAAVPILSILKSLNDAWRTLLTRPR